MRQENKTTYRSRPRTAALGLSDQKEMLYDEARHTRVRLAKCSVCHSGYVHRLIPAAKPTARLVEVGAGCKASGHKAPSPTFK